MTVTTFKLYRINRDRVSAIRAKDRYRGSNNLILARRCIAYVQRASRNIVTRLNLVGRFSDIRERLRSHRSHERRHRTRPAIKREVFLQKFWKIRAPGKFIYSLL